MKAYMEERVVEVGRFIVENNATVRQAAKEFSVSKSTIHKDLTERLIQVDPQLAAEVKVVLDENKSERHIRGGEATKAKYERMHKERGF